MNGMNVVCVWIAELAPLMSTLIAFVYGVTHFFKKGKPLFGQSITMAMASYFLGSLYHLCLTFTNEEIVDGFTPAYLGRMAFFLFIITASYGQLDRIVDDRSPITLSARRIAFIAPICAALLFLPSCLDDVAPIGTKIAYAVVWIPAVISTYFNLKHAIIPDCDFGFIKAIKPYNIFVLCLSFSELLSFTAWYYLNGIALVITTIAFSILSICVVVSANKGVEKWTV